MIITKHAYKLDLSNIYRGSNNVNYTFLPAFLLPALLGNNSLMYLLGNKGKSNFPDIDLTHSLCKETGSLRN